jgi:hypothetical protein
MRDRYGMSGPEEGDKVDDTVLVVDDDGTELIEIREGTLAQRKSLGRRIAKLLNQADAQFMEAS